MHDAAVKSEESGWMRCEGESSEYCNSRAVAPTQMKSGETDMLVDIFIMLLSKTRVAFLLLHGTPDLTPMNHSLFKQF